MPNTNTNSQQGAQGGRSSAPHLATQADAARVQSTQARGGHDVGQGTFASRMQSASDSRAYQASQGGGGSNAQTGGKQGGGGGKK